MSSLDQDIKRAQEEMQDVLEATLPGVFLVQVSRDDPDDQPREFIAMVYRVATGARAAVPILRDTSVTGLKYKFMERYKILRGNLRASVVAPAAMSPEGGYIHLRKRVNAIEMLVHDLSGTSAIVLTEQGAMQLRRALDNLLHYCDPAL